MKRYCLSLKSFLLVTVFTFILAISSNATAQRLETLNMDSGATGTGVDDTGADEILWLNDSSGVFGLWEGIKTTVDTTTNPDEDYVYTSTQIGSSPIDTTEWQILGIGGFGQKNSDCVTKVTIPGPPSIDAQDCSSYLLWRNKTSGLVAFWPLRSSDLAKWSYTPSTLYYDGLGVLTHMPESEWEFLAIGNFHLDTITSPNVSYIDDIAWRGSDGKIYIWRMEAEQIVEVLAATPKYLYGEDAEGAVSAIAATSISALPASEYEYVGKGRLIYRQIDDLVFVRTLTFGSLVIKYLTVYATLDGNIYQRNEALVSGDSVIGVANIDDDSTSADMNPSTTLTPLSSNTDEILVSSGGTIYAQHIDKGDPDGVGVVLQPQFLWTNRRTLTSSALTGVNIVGRGDFIRTNCPTEICGTSGSVNYDELVIQSTTDGQISLVGYKSSSAATPSVIMNLDKTYKLTGAIITSDSGWRLIGN